MVEIFIEGKIDSEVKAKRNIGNWLRGEKVFLAEGTPITVRRGENGSSHVQVPLGKNVLFQLRVDKGAAYSLPIGSGDNVLIRHNGR